MNRVSSAYLASYVLSMLGNSVAGVVLPLLVLQTTGSVLATGAVAIASAVPAAVAGLVMGVVIDRINRRTASVLTDVISALSIAALPLVDATVGLALGWFVLFAVIGSFGDVPGLTAREAMLPGVIRAGGMSAERLLGLRESLGAVVMLVGPAAGAVLVTAFDGVAVLWVTAATSAAAAAVTLLIPRAAGAVAPGPVPGAAGANATASVPGTADAMPAGRVPGGAGANPAGPRRVELREGWHTLIRSPFLRTTSLAGIGLVVVLAGFQALVLPVYFTVEGRPGMLGLVLSALAVGLLIGGGIYAAAGSRGRRRVWFVVGMLVTIGGFVGMATLADPWVVLGAAVVVGLGNGLFGSLMGVLMVERIPDAVRGRVMGVQNSFLTLAPALGMGGAAVLVSEFSVRTGAVVLAVVWLATGVATLASRALRDLEPRRVAEAEVVA